MNFGVANFLIAILRLLLFLRNEFAVAELAFHGHVRTLLEGRSECGKIAPGYKSTGYFNSHEFVLRRCPTPSGDTIPISSPKCVPESSKTGVRMKEKDRRRRMRA